MDILPKQVEIIYPYIDAMKSIIVRNNSNVYCQKLRNQSFLFDKIYIDEYYNNMKGSILSYFTKDNLEEVNPMYASFPQVTNIKIGNSYEENILN